MAGAAGTSFSTGDSFWTSCTISEAGKDHQWSLTQFVWRSALCCVTGDDWHVPKHQVAHLSADSKACGPQASAASRNRCPVRSEAGKTSGGGHSGLHSV